MAASLIILIANFLCFLYFHPHLGLISGYSLLHKTLKRLNIYKLKCSIFLVAYTNKIYLGHKVSLDPSKLLRDKIIKNCLVVNGFTTFFLDVYLKLIFSISTLFIKEIM